MFTIYTRSSRFPLINKAASWPTIQACLLLDCEVDESLLLLLNEFLEIFLHSIDSLSCRFYKTFAYFFIFVEKGFELIEVKLVWEAILICLKRGLENTLILRYVVLLGKLCVEGFKVFLEFLGIS